MRATTRFVFLVALLGGCTGMLEEPAAGPEGTPRFPPMTGRCVPGVPETSRIPRLTHEQYDNTVQDLLSLPDVHPSTMLPPESTGSVDARMWDGYVLAAETLAAAAIGDATSRAAIVTCTPSGDGSACAREVIEGFGRRAFRRPLTSTEIARFEALYAARADLTETGSFEEGVELLVEAFLESPSFLVRAELSTAVAGGRIPLEDHDVASRLSYLIWNSMPDETLLAAADAGELSSGEQIRAQAERMVRAPRARGMVAAFHREWLGMEGQEGARWIDIVRDPERYPDFSPDLVPLLSEETMRYVDLVVFEREGGFRALLTEPTGFVNRDLAPYYGLDPAAYGDALEETALDPTRRSGIFTRLGFLASHAMYDRTSPILRGAYIQKHVLCFPLGTPPPGAEMTPLPEITPDIVTTRQRVELQTSPDGCAVCHAVLNPPGFAFEHFDALGGWRDLDNGAPIDASGIAQLGRVEAPFESAVDLSASIADAPAAHACYAQHWVEYAYRRTPTDEDRCVIEELSTRLGDDGYSILDLVVDLTQSETFLNRSAEVTP